MYLLSKEGNRHLLEFLRNLTPQVLLLSTALLLFIFWEKRPQAYWYLMLAVGVSVMCLVGVVANVNNLMDNAFSHAAAIAAERDRLDAELAALLCEKEPQLTPDTLAHQREHSLEVMVPFLAALNPATRIVPICVSHPSLDTLLGVGKTIGRTLRAFERPVSILVSSDMSHFVAHDLAKELDTQALEPALQLDAVRFFETVRGGNISMCGVLPMTVGIAAALELGASQSEITAYATSGQVNGEMRRVVGYAGMLVS
jgi:hypothetical protein